MNVFSSLVKRNVLIFFKDKGMFFTSLVTPAILLVLYTTFLGGVFYDSFAMNLPTSTVLPDDLLDGLVGSQLISSILSVSCITVAFCSNFLMVQDKANGTYNDFRISPVKSSTLSLAYFIATLISTLLVCLTATAICLVYLSFVGFYMTAVDVLLLTADVFILSLFGTALSSFVNLFLSSEGQISAVSAIINAGYGFICGAYMPLSTFGEGLRNAVAFLPGTYGTSLVKNHALQGALNELQEYGIPENVIDSLKDSLDCNIYFFGTRVSVFVSYLVLTASIAILISAYVLLNKQKNK